MRLNSTLTQLTDEDWTMLQELLRPSYEIKPDVTRVCLTVVHGAEERHTELPLGTFVEILAGLSIQRTVRKALTALAALSPDTLPDTPENRCPDGVPDCPIKHAAPAVTCDHGAAVVKEDPSMFEGAAPVRTFSDGCQSYGPYAGEKTGEVDK